MIQPMRAVLAILLAAPGIAVPAAAADPVDSAVRRVAAYVRAHNAHDVDAAMRFYAPDATFQLSGGRQKVRGLAGIRELERFDAVAGSHVVPEGYSARRDGRDVRIGIRKVVERSRVFAALGLATVTTLPEADAFLVRDGRFLAVVQPTIRPECTRVAMAGIGGAIAWLRDRRDPRRAQLVDGEAPRLTTGTIPQWVAVIGEWRRATGWRPDPGDVAGCADGSQPAGSRPSM